MGDGRATVRLWMQAEIREAEVKRLLQERANLREQLCESRARNSEMTSLMGDLQFCLNDLQSKVWGQPRTQTSTYFNMMITLWCWPRFLPWIEGHNRPVITPGHNRLFIRGRSELPIGQNT